MLVAMVILTVIGAYGAVGIVFGILFVAWGAPRLDPAASGTSAVFRILILPASAALWPLLLVKWIHSPRPGTPP